MIPPTSPTPRRATRWWPPPSRRWPPWTWSPAGQRRLAVPAAALRPDDRRRAPADRASSIRATMAERLTVEVPGGRMWAWACDESGRTECRDEPPLGLRTLPFWGIGANDDPVQRATCSWLSEDNPYHYREPSAVRAQPTSPTPPASTSPAGSSIMTWSMAIRWTNWPRFPWTRALPASRGMWTPDGSAPGQPWPAWPASSPGRPGSIWQGRPAGTGPGPDESEPPPMIARHRAGR